MKIIDKIKEIGFSINIAAIIRFIRKHLLVGKLPERKFGYIRDTEDDRDIMYKILRPGRSPLSTNRKNIEAFGHIYDQEDIGSCVGQGIVEAFRRVLQVNGQPDFDASRLFAYYIARQDKNNDTGATIRDGFKAINKYGLCSEENHPYVPSRFARTPSIKAFNDALDHQSIQYERLPQTKEAIMDAVSRGYPVVYGKKIFDSFTSRQVAATGIVPVPDPFREKSHGGHCMVIFDYDQKNTIEPNSWGRSWGRNGVCEVPWEYVLDTKLCSDFWVIYLTE
jgi:C1A family cysteine protease